LSVVIDASVAVAWCLEDETSPYAVKVLATLAESEAHVPSIWPLEVANALLVAERRGRLSVDETTRAVSLLRELPIRVDHTPPDTVFTHVLSIARTQFLSVYDAAYVELAVRIGAPIATLDDRLQQAASQLGVGVVKG